MNSSNPILFCLITISSHFGQQQKLSPDLWKMESEADGVNQEMVGWDEETDFKTKLGK